MYANGHISLMVNIQLGLIAGKLLIAYVKVNQLIKLELRFSTQKTVQHIYSQTQIEHVGSHREFI